MNTVRHYHRVGVLEEPDRMSNGYKKYEVRHLIRLLQIRRLRDLGVPVDRIQQVGFGDDTPTAALTAVDADLAKSIERLQRARAEISAILIGSSVTDLPPGFEGVALYNPAQLDVIVRASRLAHEQMQQRDAEPADEGRASE
ncbi:MerR family transcriptional regulator [Salinibacterium hongtaonis]|uniref:MerR family transcriptional regulator n=1 Tax=Homoserinimonas hongtaonis TaxID=2079791 RepID=UPI001304EAF7|nr:MerR family transcriptional regulator [Salinibacterium hongtaonis]